MDTVHSSRDSRKTLLTFFFYKGKAIPFSWIDVRKVPSGWFLTILKPSWNLWFPYFVWISANRQRLRLRRSWRSWNRDHRFRTDQYLLLCSYAQQSEGGGKCPHNVANGTSERNQFWISYTMESEPDRQSYQFNSKAEPRWTHTIWCCSGNLFGKHLKSTSA